MEILEAYDLTGSCRAAAELAGCDHHTVARYVKMREAGQSPTDRKHRDRAIDAFCRKSKYWWSAPTADPCRHRPPAPAGDGIHRLGSAAPVVGAPALIRGSARGGRRRPRPGRTPGARRRPLAAALLLWFRTPRSLDLELVAVAEDQLAFVEEHRPAARKRPIASV